MNNIMCMLFKKVKIYLLKVDREEMELTKWLKNDCATNG